MADLHPHVAILPNAGMGHLMPFLRFAASLVHQNCRVTLITIRPTVSNAESQLISRFLSTFHQVSEKQFHLLPFDPATATSTDPFWHRWEAARRSVNVLLSPLLSTVSPPLSALVYDFTLTSSVIPVARSLSLPAYILFTSSARMFSFFVSFSTSALDKISSGLYKLTDFVEIPGLPPVSFSLIPPPLLNPKHLFTTIAIEDSVDVMKLDGILINSFEKLEPDSIKALNGGKVVQNLPPLHAIGPLLSCEFEKTESSSDAPLKWLNEQPAGSVVYVSFGSRIGMSKEQIREIADGLITSGYKFIWVVKTKKVDREDEEDLDVVLGQELMQRTKEKGLVVKYWVDQNEILAHKAVGGFVSHCGWNSVVEAARHGVRILAWPQLGDQKINAEVVESVGLGLWARSWGWGEEVLVKGDEIGEKVKEMMESELLRVQAANIKTEARKAVEDSGSSGMTFKDLLKKWKNSDESMRKRVGN